MDHKQLVRAAERSELPYYLVAEMKRAFGHYPAEVARKILFWSMARMIVAVAGLAIVIPIGLALLLNQSGDVSKKGLGFIIVWCVVWFGICLVAYFICDYRADQRKVPDEIKSFGSNLSLFLHWIDRDLTSVVRLSLDDFCSLATRVLVDRARLVLICEAEHRNIHGALVGNEVGSMKLEFEYRYRALHALCLCSGSYNSFFDTAESELAAEAA